MLIRTVRVSGKGQIAIPVDIRAAAGIAKGDELVIAHESGRLLLEKAEGLSRMVGDDFKDMLRFSESAMRKVWDNDEDEAWNAAAESGRGPRVPVQQPGRGQAKARARRQQR